MECLSEEELVQLLHMHGMSGGGVEAIVGDSITRKMSIMRKRQTDQRLLSEIKKWLEQEPVMNGTMHYSCIKDSSAEGGELVWVRRYPIRSY